MTDLHVRDIDTALLLRLEERARGNGRSIEQETVAVLEDALLTPAQRFVKRAAELRARTAGLILTDSTDIIRQDRDSR